MCKLKIFICTIWWVLFDVRESLHYNHRIDGSFLFKNVTFILQFADMFLYTCINES